MEKTYTVTTANVDYELENIEISYALHPRVADEVVRIEEERDLYKLIQSHDDINKEIEILVNKQKILRNKIDSILGEIDGEIDHWDVRTGT
jgi:chaperonin cofactor prefoldin